MGTKSNPGEFDCYAAADPDEPMFILLARDKHAPTLVWLWATLRELDNEDPSKVKEARQCVQSMLEWMHDHNRKAVGLGMALIGASMELCRAANMGIRVDPLADKVSDPTDIEVIRRFLCETLVDDPS